MKRYASSIQRKGTPLTHINGSCPRLAVRTCPNVSKYSKFFKRESSNGMYVIKSEQHLPHDTTVFDDVNKMLPG